MLTQTFIVDFEELRDLAVVYERYLAEMRFPLMVDADLSVGERVRLRVNLPDGSGVNIAGKVVGAGPDGEGFTLSLPSNEDTRWLVGKAVELTVRIRRMMAAAPYSGPDRRSQSDRGVSLGESAASSAHVPEAPHGLPDHVPTEVASQTPTVPRLPFQMPGLSIPASNGAPIVPTGFAGYGASTQPDGDPNMQTWVPASEPLQPPATTSSSLSSQEVLVADMHHQLTAIRTRDLDAKRDTNEGPQTAAGTPVGNADHLTQEGVNADPDPALVMRGTPDDSLQRWPTDTYPAASTHDDAVDAPPLLSDAGSVDLMVPAPAFADQDQQVQQPRFPVDEYLEPVAVEWEEQEGRTLAASAEELKLDVGRLLEPSAPLSVEARIAALAMGDSDGWEVAEAEELQQDAGALPADTLYDPLSTRTFAEEGQTLKGRTALFTDPNLEAPPESEPFANNPGGTALFTDPNLSAPSPEAPFHEQGAGTAMMTDMGTMARHDDGPFSPSEVAAHAPAGADGESGLPFSVQRTLELCLDAMTPLDQIPRLLALLSTEDLVILLQTRRLRPLIAGFAQRLLDERHIGS